MGVKTGTRYDNSFLDKSRPVRFTASNVCESSEVATVNPDPPGPILALLQPPSAIAERRPEVLVAR